MLPFVYGLLRSVFRLLGHFSFFLLFMPELCPGGFKT